MAIAAVVVVTLFVGVNIATWTGWVFFALGIEIVLIWVYTVCTVMLTLSLVLTRSAGYLLCYQAWVVRNPSLRQRPLPVPIGVLLARPAIRHPPRPPPALRCQGIQIHLQSKRHRPRALPPQA